MSMPDYKPHFKIQIGDTAVNFKATIQDGSIIELNKIKSKWIVLFFYPEDNTPTCTKEACNLRDHFKIIKDCGAIIFGISPDTEAKHQKFISKFSLPYDLIADVNHEISSAYGCLLYTSDAADERSSVDLGGRRIIKTKKQQTKKKNILLSNL